jgi:NADH-quinone oxidoreductase subunit M
MSFFQQHPLSVVIFFPAFGALLLLILKREWLPEIRKLALLVSVLEFLLSCRLWLDWGTEDASLGHFAELVPWLPRFGISYSIGLDGIALLLVILTTLITPLAILASWNVEKNVRDYMMAFLVLEAAMLGCFSSTDLVLFYVFWELMLVPMFLLIGVWGGPRRVYAAMKFFLYTLLGGLPMLIAILWLGALHREATGTVSFLFRDLMRLTISPEAQGWLFLAFALAFAIKVPLFPFHTWLPDAHVEAPTAGSVILAAILLKFGCFGYIRYAIPLFPAAAAKWTGPILILAVVGIIYGSLVAFAQKDVKKLVAYSSVAHLGFVMLGIFAGSVAAAQGAVLQMINHGISTGALFLLVGFLYERRHTRDLDQFGGLASVAPLTAGAFVIVSLSSIGLPGTNGFIGEFLVLAGTFRQHKLLAALAAIGVVLGAVYMLTAVQRIFWGEITHEENRKLPDLTLREGVILLPLLILIFVIGVYPSLLLRKTEPPVRATLAAFDARSRGTQRTIPVELEIVPRGQEEKAPPLPAPLAGGEAR